MTLDDQIRAERARQLLDDDVLVSAFAVLEADAVDALANADVSDHPALLKSAAALQAARALPAALRQILERGTERPAPSARFA